MSGEEIEAALAAMGETRTSADLDQVLVDLPGLVSGAQSHAHTTGTPEAWALVVEAYSTVYWLAARHRWMTLADLAVTKQKVAAQQSDPVTVALAARDEAGVYLNHGEFEDGLAVVDRAITQVEQQSTTGRGRSYALGILHLRGLTLAGRLQDKRTADQHIARAAGRLGGLPRGRRALRDPVRAGEHRRARDRVERRPPPARGCDQHRDSSPS
jgi:hypothetical protein